MCFIITMGQAWNFYFLQSLLEQLLTHFLFTFGENSTQNFKFLQLYNRWDSLNTNYYAKEFDLSYVNTVSMNCMVLIVLGFYFTIPENCILKIAGLNRPKTILTARQVESQ